MWMLVGCCLRLFFICPNSFGRCSRVLELLWRYLDEALSKPFLYQQVLRRVYVQYDCSLDMYVSYICCKLQVVGYEVVCVDIVWGKGYVLVKVGI